MRAAGRERWSCSRAAWRSSLRDRTRGADRRADEHGRRRRCCHGRRLARAVDRARSAPRACGSYKAAGPERSSARPPAGSFSVWCSSPSASESRAPSSAPPLSMLAVALVLAVVLRRRLGAVPTPTRPSRRFARLLAGAWAPVLGLTLLAVLQNIDVIIVKHRRRRRRSGRVRRGRRRRQGRDLGRRSASAYYLRAGGGAPDGRRQDAIRVPCSCRALAIIALIAVPMLLVYAAAAEPAARSSPSTST